MTKYGYNDREWDKDIITIGTRFVGEILHFNREGYIPFMKRKTVTEDELKALKALTEMVELLNEHVKNLPVK